MLYQARNKYEQRLRYKLKKLKKIVTFDILNNISENITKVQLTDSLGNANHAVSVVEKWIFDSNYENILAVDYKKINVTCFVLMKINTLQY